MILKASTRGSPSALARHLMNAEDNEHIRVHSVDGFVSQDIHGAMSEVEVLTKGIRSRQPLFSLSLSPPAHELVRDEVFESAINDAETRLGLSGQPRIIVFHEKEARRHAHVVWSRIDAETMTVKPMPFYKKTLNQLAKSIYLEQGWDLPKGFVSKAERDPRSFTLDEWQQAKLHGLDAQKLKEWAQEAWAASKDNASFAKELEARGMYLTRGDRRGHVAMTYEGSVHALSRLLNRKTKEVRERLGEPDTLRSVEETRVHIRERVAPMLQKHLEEARSARTRDMAGLEKQRFAMQAKHQLERARMEAGLKARAEAEQRDRASRMRHGVAGLWDWLSGKAKQVAAANQKEAWDAARRDRDYRQSVIDSQLEERQRLQAQIVATREQHFQSQIQIHRDLSRQFDKESDKAANVETREDVSQNFNTHAARLEWLRTRKQQRAPDPASNRADSAQWLHENRQRKVPPVQAAPQRPERDRDQGMEP